LEDIENAKVTRNQLLDMLSYPDGHFQEIVSGSFTRVADKHGRYRMCQIVRVEKASKEYAISTQTL
jgi:hypothetical protein